jgi:dTDP-4-dehydrorhamnose reductase
LLTETTSAYPVLIVGADGLIGRSLVDHFESSGNLVWRTTRRHDRTGDKCIYLDVSSDLAKWLMPPVQFRAAIICTAVTSLEQCRIDPIGSAKINVDGPINLAKYLVDKGVFVVFISSNLVFDGSRPFAKSTDLVTPITEYGRQKALAEQALLRLRNKVAVVRFSKILNPEFQLFQDWMHHLSIGKTIYPFIDMVFSPVSLNFAVQVLQNVVNLQISGITQVSASQDITYYDVAKSLARKFNFNLNLLQPIEFNNVEYSKLPLYSTLDINRLKTELILEVPSVWETIDGLVNR